MISHKHKCIFIHIPRTAGTSIENNLKPKYINLSPAGSSHKTVEYYKDNYPDEFLDYFKFTFVRNPWGRIFSLFKYYSKGGNLRKYDKKIAKEIGDDFNEFCMKILKKEECSNNVKKIFCNQLDYIQIKKNIKVNFIGRFEDINKDYKKIASILKLPSCLPKLRKTAHNPYWQYYNEKSKKIVREKFREDIEYFSYKFEKKHIRLISKIITGIEDKFLKIKEKFITRLIEFIAARLPFLYKFLKKINKKY